jgi:hypothetical protein
VPSFDKEDRRSSRKGLIGVLLMCPIKTFMREREREVAQKS